MNTIIKTKEQLAEALNYLYNAPKIAYDTETTGIRWYNNRVFLHSFATLNRTFVVRTSTFGDEDLIPFLKAILEKKDKIIVGQNLKFDRHHLKHTHGVDINGEIRDTMLMSHLMDENSPTGLKPRSEKVLGIKPDEKDAVHNWLTENIGANKDKWDFSLVPEHIMDPYAGNDPWLCMKLEQHYWPSIQKEFKGVYDTDMKVFDILYRMERNGMPIDLGYMKQYQAILEERLMLVDKQIFTDFGGPFEIDSPMEVAEVLYRKMKLPVPVVYVKDPTGKKQHDSTSDEYLSKIDHPVARGIQEHRSIAKMLSTYVIPLQEMAVNGVIHPDFGLTRTRTGRFSCSDPNVQNITKDIELRRAFTVDPGEEMLFWDQSQIEMVGFAMYSRDPKMQEALRRGDDLHTVTAQEVLAKKEVVKEERAMGKGTNFAMIYGVGKAKLASYLSGYVGRVVTDSEALQFKTKYLAAFPTVYSFQRLVMNTVQSYRQPWGNFVKNKFGRVRRIDPSKAYTGVNHLIQGWAADMMKAAMVKIDEKYKPKWRQNIHDAIRIDMPSGDNTEFIRDVAKLITDFPDVGLPIKCTVERSRTNWAEVEDIKL